MRGFWRPLALAAALHVGVAVGVSMAQTVIVTQAPPGSPVELVLNADAIGSATSDAQGVATLDVNLAAHGRKSETDLRFYLDVCGTLRRVLLVEPGWSAQVPGAGCARRELVGVYLTRSVTTFVVDVSDAAPSVRLRQGPAPKAWLSPEVASSGSGRVWAPLPKGLVVFGGGGLGLFRDAVSVSCGQGPACGGDDTRFTYTVGATYWLTRFLGAEVSYLKPGDINTSGDGGFYRFDSRLETQILTIAGKGGLPLGPVRLYGQAGATYNWATSITVQTIDDSTVEVDGVEQAVPGGTQTFGLKTEGWSWMFGGGLEGWLTKWLAVYGEAGYVPLKGDDTGRGEGRLDDRVIYFVAGARVHIGR